MYGLKWESLENIRTKSGFLLIKFDNLYRKWNFLEFHYENGKNEFH